MSHFQKRVMLPKNGNTTQDYLAIHWDISSYLEFLHSQTSNQICVEKKDYDTRATLNDFEYEQLHALRVYSELWDRQGKNSPISGLSHDTVFVNPAYRISQRFLPKY